MKTKLSLIIPCYNEEKRFDNGISHFLNYLKKQKYKWELVIVNDGSKDKTLDLIKQVKNPNVKFITYGKNRGKGYAIVKGVEKAKGEIILFSDLDHAVPIDTLESFFSYFDKGFQVVIGSRRVKGAKLIKRQHPLREFLGKCFTFLVRILIDFKIKDATCGFKAFKKDVGKKLFRKITIYDWAFDAELLYLCNLNKINYIQAPVNWTDVKGSKVSIMRDVFQSIIGLIKIRINDFSGKY